MGKKGAMPSYKTIDHYIASQPKEAQDILQELRSIIKTVVPEAIEIVDAKVPSFTLIPDTKPKQQIMIAAYTKAVSFYPFEKTVANFLDELQDYDYGKGSVKFPYNKPLPKDLITRMVIYRKEELENA